ncbi:hypothetical protein BCON_0325g00160 [Botryotinia convoluta]|uniref:Uncharacterized protein n=1 Tax=Botryotinia convoluta TaxID=54673 RepID=A0A4Z1HB97_9HELO|nr:hypothetical protein BCON_0325g00160 [Botryotinia convoluta]
MVTRRSSHHPNIHTMLTGDGSRIEMILEIAKNKISRILAASPVLGLSLGLASLIPGVLIDMITV